MYVYARSNNKEQTEVYAVNEPRNALTGASEAASVSILPVGSATNIIKLITEGDEASGQPKLVIQPYDEAVSTEVLSELDPEASVRFRTGLMRSQAVKLYGEDALSRAEKRSQWRSVRQQRSTLLSACDWTQLADANLNATQKSAWQDYRQQLRDITSAFASPQEVVWPKKPS